jgi:hypothetical protein
LLADQVAGWGDHQSKAEGDLSNQVFGVRVSVVDAEWLIDKWNTSE